MFEVCLLNKNLPLLFDGVNWLAYTALRQLRGRWMTKNMTLFVTAVRNVVVMLNMRSQLVHADNSMGDDLAFFVL